MARVSPSSQVSACVLGCFLRRLRKPEPVSGESCYWDRYAPAAGQAQKEEGIKPEIIYYGKALDTFVGPEGEWDAVLLVKWEEAGDFVKLMKSETLRKGTVHRTAALLDSRLIATKSV